MDSGRGLKRSEAERAVEVVAAHEADLRVEVVADVQVLDRERRSGRRA